MLPNLSYQLCKYKNFEKSNTNGLPVGSDLLQTGVILLILTLQPNFTYGERGLEKQYLRSREESPTYKIQLDKSSHHNFGRYNELLLGWCCETGVIEMVTSCIDNREILRSPMEIIWAKPNADAKVAWSVSGLPTHKPSEQTGCNSMYTLAEN
jgi:hypothetical protein